MTKQKDTPEELEGKTKAELVEVAKDQGVDVKSSMTKAEIVDELQTAGVGETPAEVVSTDGETNKNLVATPADSGRFGGRLTGTDLPPEEEVPVAAVAPAVVKPEPLRDTETEADRFGRAGLGR